ncbi:Bacteriophage CI repressor helix-turn-helix domain-containing protein [Ruminococcus sp. YE71]|uniref:S24 family peptidase n=1 Tax=unclassified Ruminococcus TaxID=2608920 RepID=UPI000883EBBA|nr:MULTISPECIES: S24 family peptidase [unclassified Ruminococcus]SDA20044.1 Bacteriophage CI repressor helix-turn-helix domain-containing protein [Ruminococcus sp. YE78]SFW31749.1 Bacteriophage CI repressor helix-turn-helix domain-containing protein [Ruminococcus sp. YE71]
MDILNRITELLGDKEQQELTDYLKLQKSAYTDWKAGKSKSYRKYLIEIAEYFGVSIDYLVYGKQSSSPSENLSDDELELLAYYNKMIDTDKAFLRGEAKILSGAFKTPYKEPKKTIFIETYSLPVSAGTGVYLDNCEREMIRVLETNLTHEANFALRVSGDSMEPDFHDGDTLLIRSQPTVEPGEVGIFILNGEGYVKEFGGDCLISHNPKYKNIKLDEYGEIYCRGLVIGVLEDDDFV